MSAEDDCLPASLAGRCASGRERGQGMRVHAVPRSDELERNDYCVTRALCGAKPGPRSAGWSYFGQRAVTCPRCATQAPNAAGQAPAARLVAKRAP